jgi:hypothetical protein
VSPLLTQFGRKARRQARATAGPQISPFCTPELIVANTAEIAPSGGTVRQSRRESTIPSDPYWRSCTCLPAAGEDVAVCAATWVQVGADPSAAVTRHTSSRHERVRQGPRWTTHSATATMCRWRSLSVC